MGNAYVGLADDISSIFLNPAGLAKLKTWQAMSMTTKLLNTIDYVSMAGSYYTDWGTFGLGYVGASLGGSFVTGLTLVEDRGIVFPIASSESIDYSSTVVLLSYGSEAKRFLGWLDYGFIDQLSVGATLKIFSQGLSGGTITNGTMSGYDMDFGLLYQALPWLSLGFNEIDALPESAGGKLTDSSGENSQIIPAISKAGMAVRVMGPQDALYEGQQPLYYMLDLNYMSSQTDSPTLLSSGLEWWPSDYLALRVGFDQDVIGTDVENHFETETNLTAGAGIEYLGFKFDYAYHRFGLITENDTSYISLSYAAPVESPPPPPKPKEYLRIISPQDKTTVYDEAVVIRGELLNVNEITALRINGNDVSFYPSGTFEATYPLSLGKNAFKITAINHDTVVGSGEVRLLRLVSFKDVPMGYWSKEPIEMLATLKIIGGYPDGTFRPDKTINRAELTTLLIKAKGISSTETTNTMFYDVTNKHWASFYVKQGVDLGIVTGYPDKTFRPANMLNRAEGVTLLARFANLTIPETLVEGPYIDVPGRHWAAKSITAARSAGMLVYLLDKPFEPNKALSRSEAAEILSKTPFAVSKINDLKDFDTY